MNKNRRVGDLQLMGPVIGILIILLAALVHQLLTRAIQNWEIADARYQAENNCISQAVAAGIERKNVKRIPWSCEVKNANQ